MCLILFAHRINHRYPLVLAANRDEFLDRPTRTMHWWDPAGILAGRDEQAGGTWFGMNQQGRWAAVTNYRGPQSNPDKETAISRGALVTDFLTSQGSAFEYLKSVKRNGNQYRGFNLLVSDSREIYYFGNRDTKSITPRLLPPGLYGLSNDLLQSSWPKVELGKSKLANLLDSDDVIEHQHLFEILSDSTRPSDEQLPDTGVGLATERQLSSMFIKSADYGTRCSTSLIVHDRGLVEIAEASHPEKSIEKFSFEIPFDSQ